MEYHLYWLIKSSCFEIFGDRKYDLFSSQEVDGNMMFIDYWKVLGLDFSEIGNTVFFESKSWWKDDIYWLPKKSCFELFEDGKYGLSLSQKVDGKIIFTDHWKVLVLNFSLMKNTAFFQPKRWWKDDIYLVFMSFPWYSRTWEIWFFVQCELSVFYLFHPQLFDFLRIT